MVPAIMGFSFSSGDTQWTIEQINKIICSSAKHYEENKDNMQDTGKK